MRTAFCSVALIAVARAGFPTDTTLGQTWLEDVLEEITEAPIAFEGELPEYVKGLYVQGGPAQYKLPKNEVTHIFDGFAKHIILNFKDDGSVLYTNTFLKGSYYNESIKNGAFAHALLMGDTNPPSRWTLDLLAGHNDNNFIKPHRIGRTQAFLQDTTVMTCTADNFKRYDRNVRDEVFAFTPGDNWGGNAPVAGHLCVSATMAHGHSDPHSAMYTAVMGCSGGGLFPDYHVVFNINPDRPEEREKVAHVELRNGRSFSYMHAIGYTASHIVIVAQPMHLDLKKAIEGNVIQDSLFVGNGTLFTVVNRYDGSYRDYPLVDGFFFGHVANTWEEGEDILLDLTYYEAAPDLGFIKLFARDHFFNHTWQKSVAKPKWMRFRLTKDGHVEKTQLLLHDQGTIFELPIIDERRDGKPYCVFYGFQSFANAYDVAKDSKVIGPPGALAIGKRNLCTGERSGFYQFEEYPTEPKFIPRPGGTAEDDGVLVGLVYNASSRSSFVSVIDAKTMDRIALAHLPVRTHFLFHSTWFPSETYQSSSSFASFII